MAAGENSYHLAFLAADFLMQSQTDGNLLTFWDTIGQGATWEAAFQYAFGLSPDAFYGQFEAYREGW